MFRIVGRNQLLFFFVDIDNVGISKLIRTIAQKNWLIIISQWIIVVGQPMYLLVSLNYSKYFSKSSSRRFSTLVRTIEKNLRDKCGENSSNVIKSNNPFTAKNTGSFHLSVLMAL